MAATIALLVAACGNDDDGAAAGPDEATVYPFEEVQARDMTFEADPSELPGSKISRRRSQALFCDERPDDLVPHFCRHRGCVRATVR